MKMKDKQCVALEYNFMRYPTVRFSIHWCAPFKAAYILTHCQCIMPVGMTKLNMYIEYAKQASTTEDSLLSAINQKLYCHNL